MDFSSKRSTLIVFFLMVFLLQVASMVIAHATIVIGEVVASPTTPQAGQPFTLQLSLEDPLGTPTEDAIVAVEFRPLVDVLAVSEQNSADVRNAADALILSEEDGEKLPNIRSEFREISPGVYETRATLPNVDTYHMAFRDNTYKQEEARAFLAFDIVDEANATTQNDAIMTFLFPPTATGPMFLWLWLLLLIGVPLIAAAIVTVVVLRNAKNGKSAKINLPTT